MKTLVTMLLAASRESKAGDWRLRKEGNFAFTHKQSKTPDNTLLLLQIFRNNYFLNMPQNEPTYLKSGSHWVRVNKTGVDNLT